MLKKYDESVIKRWAGSEELVRGILNSHPNLVMICGGAARWMVSPNDLPPKFNDIDIYGIHDNIRYFLSKKGYDIIQTQLQDRSVYNIILEPNYPNLQCIAYTNFSKSLHKVSFSEVLHNFDFTICKVAMVMENSNIVVYAHPEFFEQEENKVLKVEDDINKATIFIRIAKYIRKGYKLSSELALKMLPLIEEDTPDINKYTRSYFDWTKPIVNSSDMPLIAEIINKAYAKHIGGQKIRQHPGSKTRYYKSKVSGIL